MQHRLNTFISGSGYCSRREADRLIEDGRVTINGKKASIGARIFSGQKVRVNGLLIDREITSVYIAFNKPVGVVCSSNPQENNNIVDFISHEQRIFPIGRLDKDSQGLILLTNDGDIVNKILRVGNDHKKEYIVTVDKAITDDFVTGMTSGVPILDRVTRKCTLEKISPTMFKIVLTQGLNRQIRRMCEHFGYEVTKLERTQVMNIRLDKLGQGNWRDLTDDELNKLFDMLEGSEKTETKKAAPKAVPKPPKEKPAGKTSREWVADKKIDKKSDEKGKKGDKDFKKAPFAKNGKPKEGELTETPPKKKKAPSGERIGKQRASKLEVHKPKARKWYTNPKKKD